MTQDWCTVLRRVNLNHLTAFMAVVEHQSFRAAASHLHLSQSALSVQIQQLEEAIGVTVLQRNTRSVSLTNEGARLREVFERTGIELALVISQLRDEGRLKHGAILLAVLPSLASTYMSVLLPEFRARYPGIQVKMRDVDSRRAYEEVTAGAVDLSFLSSSARATELGFQPLFREQLKAIVPAEWSDFPFGQGVNLSDVICCPMLLNPPGVDLREQLDVLFAQLDCEVRPVQELTSTSSLIALVSAGMGATILPVSSLHGLDLRRCRVLDIRPECHRAIGIVTAPGRTLSPAATAFRRFMMEKAAAMAYCESEP